MLDKPAPFQWTDEKIEKAKDLIRRGYSAQQVAVQIDAPSRNVVIGKMNRLGFAGGGSPATSGKTAKKGEPKPRHTVGTPGTWTPERERIAIEMFTAGHSHDEIASALGGIEKSGVGHYLRKRGYKRDYTPAVRSRIGKMTAALSPAISDGKTRKPPRILDSSEADIPLPESRKISLMQIKAGLCRWPLGDPLKDGFCYCGADTDLLTHSYCPSHRLLARGSGTPSERNAIETAKAVA